MSDIIFKSFFKRRVHGRGESGEDTESDLERLVSEMLEKLRGGGRGWLERTIKEAPYRFSINETESHHMTQQFHSWYMPKRAENMCPRENLCRTVHSSIIHNSQK